MTKPDAMPTPRKIGEYSLLEVVGEGGIGTVYRAANTRDGQIVAVKVMAPDTAENPILLKRFEQEFKTAQLVRHPNVVRALAFDASGNIPYLVMEYVAGESLGEKVERDGPIPEPEAIRLILQVCQGVHWIHKQGIIHRDIKPDNVLVTPRGEVKLTDLGLVKDRWSEGDLTNSGRGLGTPHYMAPEQFRNAKHADTRADIYGIGATLYTMVTGKIPFETCGSLDALIRKSHNEVPSARSLIPSLSERIDWVIRRAMSGDVDQRPQTCKDFARDLIGEQTLVKPQNLARETLPELPRTRSAAIASHAAGSHAAPTPSEIIVPLTAHPSDCETVQPPVTQESPRWEFFWIIVVVWTMGFLAAVLLLFLRN